MLLFHLDVDRTNLSFFKLNLLEAHPISKKTRFTFLTFFMPYCPYRCGIQIFANNAGGANRLKNSVQYSLRLVEPNHSKASANRYRCRL